MRPGQGRCLQTLKGCQSEEEEAQPGCGGQRQGCYRASQEGGSPSSLGVCKQAQSLESVVGGSGGQGNLGSWAPILCQALCQVQGTQRCLRSCFYPKEPPSGGV